MSNRGCLHPCRLASARRDTHGEHRFHVMLHTYSRAEPSTLGPIRSLSELPKQRLKSP